MRVVIVLLYVAAVLALGYGRVRTLAGKPTNGAGYFAAGCALLAYSPPAMQAGFN